MRVHSNRNFVFYRTLVMAIFLNLFFPVDSFSQCVEHRILQTIGNTEIINGTTVSITSKGNVNHDLEHWCEELHPYEIEDTNVGTITFEFCPPVEYASINLAAVNGANSEVVKIYRNGMHYKVNELPNEPMCSLSSSDFSLVINEDGNLIAPVSTTIIEFASVKGLIIDGPINSLTIMDSLTTSQTQVALVQLSLNICTEMQNEELQIEMLDEVIQFENSASACQDDLPYTLSPQSLFENLFFVGENDIPMDEIYLDSFGTHLIKTVYDGCKYQREFELIEVCEEEIYIPNIFSPNSDGINDEFRISASTIENVFLIIYDRWGNKIFQTTNLENAWDGTFNGRKINPSVLVYHLSYTNSTTRERKQKRGTITIAK